MLSSQGSGGLIDRVERRLNAPHKLKVLLHHDTSDISAGPLETMYMASQCQIKWIVNWNWREKIRAVDEHDVSERVLPDAFYPRTCRKLGALPNRNSDVRCNTVIEECRCQGNADVGEMLSQQCMRVQ